LTGHWACDFNRTCDFNVSYRSYASRYGIEQIMERAISEIVGRADMDEGGSAQAYRALRSLLCATCGSGIAEGSLFTRRRVKGIGVRIMPQCRECSPFTLQADRKERSALLRSLLASPTDSAGHTPARNYSENASQAQSDEKKKVDEAVRRRLGPALKRGRFGRKF
jgi:hypothetical protein